MSGAGRAGAGAETVLRGREKREAGDIREVPPVVGDEGEVVGEGGRRDQQIKGAHVDLGAGTAQRQAKPRVARRHGAADGEDLDPAQEAAEAAQCSPRIPATIDAFQVFGLGDDRDRQPFRREM